MLREHRTSRPVREGSKEARSSQPPHEAAGRHRHHSKSPEARVTWSRAEERQHSRGAYGTDALRDIECLLVDSGVAPSRVLPYAASFSSQEMPPAPHHHRREDGGALYRDPSNDIPQSLMMLEGGGWGGGTTFGGAFLHQQHQQQQQLYQNQYISRLEQELAEMAEQHTTTSELLFHVSWQRDVAELLTQEQELRHRMVEDATSTFATARTFFYERRIGLREAMWRGRLEKEALRAALAEERVRARESELAEERRLAAKASASASADMAALRSQQEQLMTSQLSSLMRTLMAENTDKVASLVESVPLRVRSALEEAHQSNGQTLPPHHERSLESGGGGPLATRDRVALPDELNAAIASAIREQLASAMPNRASPVTVSPTAGRSPSVKHLTLLSNKVSHILDDMADSFGRASFEKLSLATTALLGQSAAHTRKMEEEWSAVLSGKRAEVKALREELLSLRTQRQQLLQSFHERTGSQSAPGFDSSSRTPALQHAGRGREGSSASFGVASVSGRATPVNPAYEPFSVPYIPPALKESKAPVKHSLKKLTEEALRAGARRAEELLRSPNREERRVPAAKAFSRSPSSASPPSQDTKSNNSSSSSGRDSDRPAVPTVASAVPFAQASSSPPPLGTTNVRTAALGKSATGGGLVVKSFQRRSLSSSSSSSSDGGDQPASSRQATSMAIRAAKPEEEEGEGPVKVSVGVPRVHTVGTARAGAAVADEEGSEESNTPRVMESVMHSKGSRETSFMAKWLAQSAVDKSPSLAGTQEGGERPTVGHGADASPSSPLPKTTTPTTGAPAPAPAPAPAAAAAGPLRKGLDAVHSFFPSAAAKATTAAPATTATATTATAVAKPCPFAKKSSPAAVHRKTDDDSDSLSLTLTTSSDGDSPPQKNKASPQRNGSAKNAGKADSADPSSPASPPRPIAGESHEVAPAPAPAPAPAKKRSAFDDDDDVGEVRKKGTITQAAAATSSTGKAAAVSAARPAGGLTNPEGTKPVAAPALPTTSAATAKKTIKLPW